MSAEKVKLTKQLRGYSETLKEKKEEVVPLLKTLKEIQIEINLKILSALCLSSKKEFKAELSLLRLGDSIKKAKECFEDVAFFQKEKLNIGKTLKALQIILSDVCVLPAADSKTQEKVSKVIEPEMQAILHNAELLDYFLKKVQFPDENALDKLIEKIASPTKIAQEALRTINLQKITDFEEIKSILSEKETSLLGVKNKIESLHLNNKDGNLGSFIIEIHFINQLNNLLQKIEKLKLFVDKLKKDADKKIKIHESNQKELKELCQKRKFEEIEDKIISIEKKWGIIIKSSDFKELIKIIEIRIPNCLELLHREIKNLVQEYPEIAKHPNSPLNAESFSEKSYSNYLKKMNTVSFLWFQIKKLCGAEVVNQKTFAQILEQYSIHQKNHKPCPKTTKNKERDLKNDFRYFLEKEKFPQKIKEFVEKRFSVYINQARREIQKIPLEARLLSTLFQEDIPGEKDKFINSLVKIGKRNQQKESKVNAQKITTKRANQKSETPNYLTLGNLLEHILCCINDSIPSEFLLEERINPDND